MTRTSEPLAPLASVAAATEAGAVAELTERSTYRELQVGEGWVVVGLPPGYTPHVIDETGRLLEPRRSAGDVVVHDATSFLAVLAQRGLPGVDPVAYADEEHLTLVGILNDDHSGVAGWRDYRCRLALRHTPEWKAWKEDDRGWVDQETFAFFIERHAREFTTPTAADMLELATTIEGTKSAVWKTGVRLKDGSRQANWSETVNAMAGDHGQIAIPDRFIITLIPFYGAAPYAVEAWLRFRIADGRLKLGYELDRPDLIERDVFNTLVAKVADDDDAPLIIRGPAPARAGQ